MKDKFYDFGNKPNKEELQNFLNHCKTEGYISASDFDKNIPTAEKIIGNFKKYYKGKSSLIIHLFYNNITNQNEINYGNKTVYKSYPQFKKFNHCYTQMF